LAEKPSTRPSAKKLRAKRRAWYLGRTRRLGAACCLARKLCRRGKQSHASSGRVIQLGRSLPVANGLLRNRCTSRDALLAASGSSVLDEDFLAKIHARYKVKRDGHQEHMGNLQLYE